MNKTLDNKSSITDYLINKLERDRGNKSYDIQSNLDSEQEHTEEPQETVEPSKLTLPKGVVTYFIVLCLFGFVVVFSILNKNPNLLPNISSSKPFLYVAGLIQDFSRPHPVAPVKTPQPLPEKQIISANSIIPDCKLGTTSFNQIGLNRVRAINYAKSCYPNYDKIYSWKDKSGVVNYSNVGFPENDEIEPISVKIYK